MPEEAAAGEVTQEGQQQPDESDSSEEKFDPAKWRVFQENMRKNERELADKLKAAEKRAKQLEDAGKSEAQKTAERLAALEKELTEERQTRRTLTTRSAITTAASKAGAVYPDAIARLVDPSDLDLEEDGTPRNLSTVLKGLRETYPELFKSSRGSADGGPRGKAGAPADMNSLIRQSLGR